MAAKDFQCFKAQTDCIIPSFERKKNVAFWLDPPTVLALVELMIKSARFKDS